MHAVCTLCISRFFFAHDLQMSMGVPNIFLSTSSSPSMNVNNNNGQLSTIQHFQSSSSHNLQDVLGLLQFGSHVAHSWLQNNVHGTTFSTSSPLAVGLFLHIYHLRPNVSYHILMGAPTGSKSTRNFQQHEYMIQSMHLCNLTYIHI